MHMNLRSSRSSYEVAAKFARSLIHFSSIWNYHKLAYVRSSPEVAFNFIRNCPELSTKFNQVSFRSSCEVDMNFICMMLLETSYEVGPKFDLWEDGLKFVQSWPEVCAKLARSSCEVGPKFAQSFAAKFTSKCKHIICAYRTWYCDGIPGVFSDCAPCNGACWEESPFHFSFPS